MKQRMSVTGVAGLVKRFTEAPGEIARTQESVLRQEGRALCVGYGVATLPGPGMDEGKREAFARRIESEVRRTFLTRGQAGRLYELVMRRSPGLAKAFWRASKQKNEAAMRRILREAGIVMEALDPAVHKKARTGNNASVPKGFKAEVMVSETQVRAYARRKAALAGFAKAGWYAAAKGLGGRVRRNIRSDDGKRRTEEIFPAGVRRLATRFPGIGGARVLSSGMRCRVEVFTRVKHAANAMSQEMQESAERQARMRVGKALREGLRQVNGKRRRVA